ncbi:threonine/serine exporter family protein [Nocardia sp. NPDC050712]|uniref:threonine/serine exporter family protein n=1 Tax=Nocardia sp. NPDC050712 TaxID=3155518 RepID=UPI0033F9DDA3
MTDTQADIQRIWVALDFLAGLAVAMLESGYATDSMHQTVTACAAAIGVHPVTVAGTGRTITVEYVFGDRSAATRTGVASTLDSVDCDRMKRLKNLARAVAAEGLDPEIALVRLAAADRGPQPWPWWIAPFGGALLALCIAVQVGGSGAAALIAAFVLVPVWALGHGLTVLTVPRLYGAAVQTVLAAGLSGMAHMSGLVTVSEAAIAIATVWVLLVPMPQLVSMSIDAISSDTVTATARAASSLLAVAGITLGGALVVTIVQNSALTPVDPRLPVLPIWLALIFSILGALGNAVFNGGGRDLLAPAAAAGLLAAAVNQTLIHVVHLSPDWSGPFSAIVLGFVAAASAERLRVPMSALILVGITGALLPGLVLYQGLVIELFHSSGVGYCVRAFTICVGLGVGAALGVLLFFLTRQRPWRKVGHARGPDTPPR